MKAAIDEFIKRHGIAPHPAHIDDFDEYRIRLDCFVEGWVANPELAQLRLDLDAANKRVEEARDICANLDKFQVAYEANTGDKHPGNKYYSDWAMIIVESAHNFLAKTKPK